MDIQSTTPKFLERVSNRLKNGSKLPESNLAFDCNGVSYESKLDDGFELSARFTWSEITSIVSYKYYCFGFDEVSLRFHANEGTIEIAESAHGWEDLARQLPLFLPGCESFDTWFQEVVSEPAETNFKTIYLRTT